LLVGTVAAFREYQHHKAWVWEHQVLTRARFVAGLEYIGAAFEQIRREIIVQLRDATALKQDIVHMREKMREAHKSKLGRFDLKQGPGGIIDVEFMVQYLVLLHGAKHPGLAENIGNIGLLERCAELGLIDSATMAEAVAAAYREYRRLIHHTKLQGQDAIVEDAELLPQRTVVKALWQQLLG
jgi:[glutamine synthetase] adenylyltransferase / [glutamine synthetase]-adenylyl-L-tyrosine phosphorylase